MAWVTCDVAHMRQFFERMEQAAKGDFRRELVVWLDGMGNDFLEIVVDRIIEQRHVVTANMVNSFHKGGSDNVWNFSSGDMTLEVGTNVEYAKFVNDGHWTIDPSKTNHFTLANGQLARFVPGHWEGGRFVYEQGAKTGMVLKQQWVDGAHYWEHSFDIFEQVFPKVAEALLQKWIDSYFG